MAYSIIIIVYPTTSTTVCSGLLNEGVSMLINTESFLSQPFQSFAVSVAMKQPVFGHVAWAFGIMAIGIAAICATAVRFPTPTYRYSRLEVCQCAYHSFCLISSIIPLFIPILMCCAILSIVYSLPV